jgi:cytochrome c-type biogenesis protein CcsB
MSTVELVRWSFYAFTAASFAVLLAAILYPMDVVWLARATRPPLANAGVAARWRASSGGQTTAGRFASLVTWIGAAFAGLAVILRAIAAGRGPYSDMYEFSVAFIFAALVGYTILEQAYRTRVMGAITLPVVLGMVAFVWSLPPGMREVHGLIPALQSKPILTAHVSSAVISYSAFALSFAAAVLYLIVERRPRSWLPSPELLDDAAFRAVAVGFPAQAMLLILGSLWAHEAWGAYWSWDPKETSALFTWLVYGVYLHIRTLRGWHGRRGAIFLALSFATVVFTYFGNYWFGGLHAYSGL